MGKTFYIFVTSIAGVAGLITYFQNLIKSQVAYTPLGQVQSPTLVLFCLISGIIFGFGLGKIISLKMNTEDYVDDSSF